MATLTPETRGSSVYTCRQCGGPLCGRQRVIGDILGSPQHCLACLSSDLGAPPSQIAQLAGGYLARRECHRRRWRRAPPCDLDGQAPCCPSRLEASDPPPSWFRPELFQPRPEDSLPEPAATVDAEQAGCGDLMVLLMRSIRKIGPGGILELIARDPGAAADVPSWCRLTGHELLAGPAGPEHDTYFIRRKADERLDS